MDFSCLAIDIGAESGRVVALSFEGAALKLSVLHRFANRQFTKDGHLCWDLEGLFEGVLAGLEKAKGLGLRPSSVGVDTWAVDYVLLDEAGLPVGDSYAYRDPRGMEKMRALLGSLGRETLYEKTGIQFQPFNTLYQLAAHHDHAGQDFSRASSLLMVPDYLHFRLCGKICIEWTNATTTQLINIADKNWDPDLLAAARIPPRLLPPLAQPGSILGPLRADIAARTHLESAVVIAPATHDTASAVVAVPFCGREKGWAYLSSGTWSLMGIESPQPLASPEALRYNFTNEGGVDQTTRVLKNIMGLWLVQRLKQELAPDLGYAELMALAAAAPQRQALIDVDHGSFMNPPSMAEAIRSFCRHSGQPPPMGLAALLRCCLESLALEYALVRRELEKISGLKIERLYIVGGGSLNGLLCQMAADACALPVSAGPVEATAIGNAMIQARALGHVKTLAEIRSRVAASFEIREYSPADSAAWEQEAQRYRLLKESIRAKN
jgi:rhamnulokinase